MKRLFSIIISSLFFATSAWASVDEVNINSYASQLNVVNNGVVDGNHNVSIKFTVMAPITSYKVYVDLNKSESFGDSGDYIYSYTGEIKGNTTVTANLTLPNNTSVGQYQWAVEVVGKKTEIGGSTLRVARDYENSDNRYRFTKALDVVVDNSYESDFFGYSYVSESYTHDLHNPSTPSDGDLRRTASTDGIYMFKPTMATVWNKNAAGTALVNNGAYTGGIIWTSDDQASHAQDQREHGPYRMATDEDGYVYVCENRPSGDGGQLVYRMDPHSPKSNFKVILKQSDLNSYSQLAKRVQSIAVSTVNGKKVLYVILSYVTTSSDASSAVYVGPNLMNNASRLCSFTINEDGDNVTLSYNNDATPLYDIQCASPSQKLAIVSTYNSMVAGVHGDLWIFQYVGSADNAKYAGTLHLYKDGNAWKCDKAIPVTQYFNVRGVGAITKDGSILAIPQSDFSVKFFDIKYTADGKLQSYTAKNWTLPAQRESGTTSGTGIWDQAVGTSSASAPNAIDGLAFDVANNLYIIAGDGDLRLTGANYTRSRLYVYACPIAENKHLTPARSSQTIKVSDAICWHPYPDSYSMTNEDLFEMFKRDYKTWYGQDLVYTENNGKIDIQNETANNTVLKYADMLTNPSSAWKWLGDYIIQCGAKRQAYKTNEDLWSEFKTDFNTYYGTNRADQPITNVAVFWPSGIDSDNDNILTNQNSKYKWLGDYIKTIAGTPPASSVEIWWRRNLHAFFNCAANYELGEVVAANFSTAGQPSAWGPAYLASTISAEAIDLDPYEWRVCLNNFFNITKETTTSNKPFIVDYTINGKPEHWYSLWLASLPATPEAVKANGSPVPVRKDHILAGWYYGTKCETGTKAYDITSPANTTDIEYACVYARWIETCLHEGEVIDPQMLKEQQATYRNFNIDLINLLSGQEVAIKIDRKLVGGMYNTMCLPFDIEGKEAFSQIVYADGTGSPFAKVGGVYPFSLVKYVGTQAGENELILDFDELGDTETLSANTPFLLKPNADITKPLKYNAARIISGGAQPASDEGDNEEDNEEGANITGQNYGKTVGEDDEYFTYTGVLAPTTIPDGSVLLVADNRLAQSTGGEMKGMRGFFTAKIQPLEMPAVVRITSRDGVTTYLDAAHTTNTSKIATKVLYNGKIYILRDGKVYTITGTRVK